LYKQNTLFLKPL